MELTRLIEHISPQRISGPRDASIEVGSLAYDSRKVEPGGVFFALRGEHADGHRFIDQAVKNGAVAVVMEENRELPIGTVGIQVANARLAMARIVSVFFGFPTTSIPVIGVTGTNGKTTTTYLIESIFRAGGYRPAVLGTINYRFENTIRPSVHTTPESLDLMEIATGFCRDGADALVLEVSSHALAQYRVDGLDFSVGVFTNLTPEHLDYHRNMGDYYASKKRFFDELLERSGGRAVINLDDPYGQSLAAEIPDALTFGRTSSAAMVKPESVEASLEGIHGHLRSPVGGIELHSPLVGTFNIQNVLAAAATGLAAEIGPEQISKGLAKAPQVPGRMERVENDRGAVILVDYAHTGDALEKALAAVKDLEPKRILTIFGCGGDRDRAKRPVMGEVACRFSDLAIVTSDNPRNEDPAAIIEDIHVGCRNVHDQPLDLSAAASGDQKGFVTIADRREAIRFAVRCLGERDVMLVAGKGHEDYQVIGPETLHFDDREEVRKALSDAEGDR
ncbi:MAG: UDP-N-acetylmuramoyl-L-alanyl-D-glutamate--2,6-diaminopimelate ligase [Desulfuromonadales bacterium]